MLQHNVAICVDTRLIPNWWSVPCDTMTIEIRVFEDPDTTAVPIQHIIPCFAKGAKTVGTNCKAVAMGLASSFMATCIATTPPMDDVERLVVS